MARIRMIKPEFFDDPNIGELSPLARLFFVGLWTQADREGRLEDDVRRLKARIFPYDAVDVECLAVELHGKDMIRRYSDAEGRRFIWIRNFTKHQRPHPKEPASVIPPCVDGAVKRNGEPCKETASPSESGFLILDSGTRNLEKSPEPQAALVPVESAVLTYPTIGANGHAWGLTSRQIDEWAGLFPGVDVTGEAMKALAWIQANPGKRKTAKGMPKFLVGWLTRAVDNGGRSHGRAPEMGPQKSKLTIALERASADFMRGEA